MLDKGIVRWVRNEFSNRSWVMVCLFIVLTGILCGIFLPKYFVNDERERFILTTTQSIRHIKANGWGPNALMTSGINAIRTFALIASGGCIWLLLPIGVIGLMFRGMSIGIFLYGITAGYGVVGLVLGVMYLLIQNTLYFIGYTTLLRSAIINIKPVFPRVIVRWNGFLYKTRYSGYAIIAGIMIEYLISVNILRLLP